jgi:broad specificity phosphatase PhoE
VTRLIVVRHGRTAWNREERFRGRTDVPLDPVGKAQAEACARVLAARFRPAAIYASPLSRTVATAEEIVLVGHNATNRVLILAALGLGNERFWRIGQDTAAVNVVTVADGTFTVVTLNDTCHLNPTIVGEEKTK